MSLFQKSVLKKHLQSLDKARVEAAWYRYSRHFLYIAKQENIRNSKEEQYQEGFLQELFVDVLGYVLNPSPGFNLTTELKNVGNAKKADGGIVHGEVLDSVKISDPVLYKYALELSRYDFDEQVDVKILGHIFEHSLNEIEEISAQLDCTAFDKTQTKRKKDGIFYKPRYITQYIVENTVSRLCTERKAALGIVEADYAQERKGRRKDVVKTLDQRLDAYQQWLFGLKICDPACGSGAFLNEAFDFLIREHGYKSKKYSFN